MRLCDLLIQIKSNSKLSIHNFKNKESSALLSMYHTFIEYLAGYLMGRFCMDTLNSDMCVFLVREEICFSTWYFRSSLPILSLSESIFDAGQNLNLLQTPEIIPLYNFHSFTSSLLVPNKFDKWIVTYLYSLVASFFFYKFLDEKGRIRRTHFFKKRSVITLLKSPNGNKKARAQFSKLLYSSRYQIPSETISFFYNYSVFADFLPPTGGDFLEICRSLYRDLN